MGDMDATLALNQLSEYLSRYYGKKVIILLDEYDTPMQEAYVHGYWKELVGFFRNMFNATFKTNPYLERVCMVNLGKLSTVRHQMRVYADRDHQNQQGVHFFGFE